MTDDTRVYEEVPVPPFQPPAQELLDTLAWLNEAQLSLYECMAFDYGHEELHALGELTPLQVDSLLARGTLA